MLTAYWVHALWTFALNLLACSLMKKLIEIFLKFLMNWTWLYDFSLGEFQNVHLFSTQIIFIIISLQRMG
jgi:hypothetical protein